MGMKYKTKKNKLPEVSASLERLNGQKIKVGALKGEHAWLAGIHEYGCTIRAQKAKYLTVPVCREAVGRKASSFTDLFVYTSKKGNKMLARNEGGSLKFYYWLTPSVKIPERSFLRAGHDENVDRVLAQTDRAISQVIAGKMTVDEMLDLCGEQMATAIKTYARNLNRPANSPITTENKGSSNPLVGQTGNMIEGITWEKTSHRAKKKGG